MGQHFGFDFRLNLDELVETRLGRGQLLELVIKLFQSLPEQ